MCYNVGMKSLGIMSLLLASPSNNVEVAFGTDADGDGVLDLWETDCVIGWDCGAWFVRKGADGACQMEN